MASSLEKKETEKWGKSKGEKENSAEVGRAGR